VKKLIELEGGLIHMTSTLVQGSTFAFTAPIASEELAYTRSASGWNMGAPQAGRERGALRFP
jgi:hypothetical protein